MKLLITGAGGQVGSELARQASAMGLQTLALTSRELDITDAAAVEAAVDGVDLLINAAAYTAVDRAESEVQRAFAVNRDGPLNLARACARRGIPLLHLSTDYLFDGRCRQAYHEDDRINPLGVYGASKWAGEQMIRETLPDHLILRVSWVFGVQGHNFVKTMVKLARTRPILRVVADQQGCPTFAGAIAETLLQLAGRLPFSDGSVWGTYHFRGTPAISWYGFSRAIVARARRLTALSVRQVLPIATPEFPTPAARPANSVLACDRLQTVFGIAPAPWLPGLEQVLHSVLED